MYLRYIDEMYQVIEEYVDMNKADKKRIEKIRLKYKTTTIERDEIEDPISVFLYALKAPETKRQYPKRLKVFLDYLKLEGTLEQQAREFLSKAKQNPQWAQSSLMQFIGFQKERAKSGQIAYSTISNYYKATKRILAMQLQQVRHLLTRQKSSVQPLLVFPVLLVLRLVKVNSCRMLNYLCI